MATDVNKDAILSGLATSAKVMSDAARLGARLAGEIDHVYLVGCGAPNRVMLGLEYWLQHYSPSIEVRRYFPAEVMAQNPARLNGRSLVLLGSKSGTTPETVEAAKFVRNRPCISVSVTQTEDLPLAQNVQHAFLLGETSEAHTGMFMVMQALMGGLMHAKDK
jgi:fructoselysine 6-phosphate deglycase